MKFYKTKTLMAAFAALFLSVSCEEDTTLKYGNVTMGNITEDKFTSDQGNIFNKLTRHVRAIFPIMKGR